MSFVDLCDPARFDYHAGAYSTCTVPAVTLAAAYPYPTLEGTA